MVLKQYNNAIYDQLGEVLETSKLVKEQDILNLGKIIRKYGYEGAVGVAIAHRHFDLGPDEAMMETTKPNLSVTQPYRLAEIEKLGGIPTAFKYGEDGWWYPIQYGMSNFTLEFLIITVLKEMIS